MTEGLRGVATGWSFVKCNSSGVYKVLVCDNADRTMGGGEIYSAIAGPFDARDEQ